MRRPIVLFCVASVGVVGCAFDWSFPADGTGNDDGGPDARGGADGASEGGFGSKDSSVLDGTFPPPACKDGASCPSGYYCEFAGGDCGKNGAPGQCQQALTACPAPTPTQMCGCNGVVYPTVCAANAARQDVNGSGTCTPPPGTFACGSTFCNEMKEFCVVSKGAGKCSDIMGCSPAACACAAVTGAGCGGSCNDKTPGQVTLTCP